MSDGRDRVDAETPLWADAANELLATLDIMAFEGREPSAFVPIGRVPEQFASRFPVLSSREVDLGEVFPFLEHFISDGWVQWNAEGCEPFKSGMWTESDRTGEPCRLEATALRQGDRRIILLAFVQQKHERMQNILQAAREHSLAYEKLQDAQEALGRARQELEDRVEERTAELTETNHKLEREIEARQRANETLLRYQEQLRALAADLTLTEERERRRIATDLHDHVGQNLAVTKIQLGMLNAEVDDPVVTERVSQIRGLLDETITYTRTLTFELAPPALYELGLEGALESLAEHARSRYGFEVRFHDDGQRKEIEHDTRLILFQSVRELIHNVAKHAYAKQVEVETALGDGEITVVVRDDGVGFDPQKQDKVESGSGFGLFNVAERLDQLGGSCEIDSGNGSGTTIKLRAPTRKRRTFDP